MGVSQTPSRWSCTGSSFHVHLKKTQILWSFSSAYTTTKQLNLTGINKFHGGDKKIITRVISIGRPLETSSKNTSYSSSPQSYLTLIQTDLYLHVHLVYIPPFFICLVFYGVDFYSLITTSSPTLKSLRSGFLISTASFARNAIQVAQCLPGFCCAIECQYPVHGL